uniref:tRNA (uracil(54)-C(5))-methyltransferase n=1 Tax=Cacopsylla melanoneura TaxID=428564 RepID=A0A8D8UXV3_9HEMI
MLIVIVREDSQDILKERKNELVKYYTDDYTLQHAIKSIYIQPRKEDCTKKSFELEFLHAHGSEFLVEDLLDINTYSAEVLFQKTLDAGDLKRKSTLVLDLWCGCGELSLLAAKRSNFVIGIDPSKWNIKKAQFMARYNKVRNIEFIIAKPEDGIKQIWQRLPMAEEIVIIADPPTLCKMYSFGEMLAEMPNVKRFLYLYSSHKLHLVKNLVSLTEASFLPTRIIPVDVSPHNVRLELIASLKRVDPHEKPLVGPGAVPALPPADWIEDIERRAFAMGKAKAMAAAAPALPARRPLPEFGGEEEYGAWGEEGLGGGYGAPAARGSFGGRGARGAPAARGGGYGAGRDAAPATGFGGGKGKFGGGGYGGGYDDYEAPAGGYGGAPASRGFGRDAGAGFGRDSGSRFGRDSGAGFGRESGAGFGRDSGAGFGAGNAAGGYGAGFGKGRGGGRGASAAGGGYGTERRNFGGFGAAEPAGYGGAGGYDEGYEEYGASFGSGFAAKRGRGNSSAGGFNKDGFGRSGFSVDAGGDFSGGFRGGRGRGSSGARGGSRGRGGRGGR